MKSREQRKAKGEELAEKLRRWVLVGQKVRRSSTPVHISFKPNPNLHHPYSSSRKLAAALWEFHHYLPSLPAPQMHRSGSTQRRQTPHPRNGGFRDSGFDLSRLLPHPSHSSPDHQVQPESANSFRRHIAQTLMRHHRAIETSNHALQPVSPASYGSSLEVAPYNVAVTPASSVELRGRAGEGHYNLRTSTELLKVLNRIWSLEEQHTTNINLIKALKNELAHARVRIKELLRDQQAERHELDGLMKQLTEDKLSRKAKEHERLNSTIQSAREELEDERKLRKRSESLHRKLARELSESKSGLSSCLKELERERKSRKILENLCDEFASGIKSYEKEVHSLKQRLDKDLHGNEDQDRVVLHIAESWLDERMQMKLEEETSGFGDGSVLEKLGFEIENLLRGKWTENCNANPCTSSRHRRNSLESVPLHDAISSPRDVGDEEDSAGSDSNCFELKKPSNNNLESKKQHNCDSTTHEVEPVKPSQQNKEASLIGKTKGQSRSPSSLQVKFEEQMAWAMSCNSKNKSHIIDTEDGGTNPVEMSVSQRSDIYESNKEGSHDLKLSKSKAAETTRGMANKNHVIGELLKSHMMLSEHQEHDNGEASCSFPPLRQASPVRQWMSKTIKTDLDVSESTTKPTRGTKEGTLKSKLVEARSKSSRPRLRLFKGAS